MDGPRLFLDAGWERFEQSLASARISSDRASAGERTKLVIRSQDPDELPPISQHHEDLFCSSGGSSPREGTGSKKAGTGDAGGPMMRRGTVQAAEERKQQIGIEPRVVAKVGDAGRCGFALDRDTKRFSAGPASARCCRSAFHSPYPVRRVASDALWTTGYDTHCLCSRLGSRCSRRTTPTFYPFVRVRRCPQRQVNVIDRAGSCRALPEDLIPFRRLCRRGETRAAVLPGGLDNWKGEKEGAQPCRAGSGAA
jgi:hypothetical protein